MIQLPQWFYRLRNKLRTAFNPIPEKIAPGNCGDCLFWWEFKDGGGGFCSLKGEIREDCDCEDTMFRKCKGIDKSAFPQLCKTCTDSYPECNSPEISFLEDHPLIFNKWNIPQRLRDLIWGCVNYQSNKVKSDENNTN